MTCNVGAPDRIIRVILGLLLIAAPFVTGGGQFSGSAWSWGAVIVGVILVATGAIRFCPAYSLLGLDTARTRK